MTSIEALRKYVLEAFNEIAESYARVRSRPWVDALKYLLLRPHRLVLDLGCGAGSNSIYLAKRGIEVVACDLALKMAYHVKKRSLKEGVYGLIDPLVSDATHQPFRGGAFDAALMIASLHNIPFKRLRVKALKCVARSLKRGGLLLLTVWAVHQYKITIHGFLRLSLLLLDPFSSLVPWKYRGKLVLRYYHFYRRSELKGDLRRAGLKVVGVFKWDYKWKVIPRNYLALALKQP